MRYVLTIDVKGEDEGAIARRLRAALKCLLRSFGIRATSVLPEREARETHKEFASNE